MGTRVRVLNIVTCSTMDVTGLPSPMTGTCHSIISIRLRMGTRVRVLNIVTCSTMDVTGLPSLIVQLIPFYVC